MSARRPLLVLATVALLATTTACTEEEKPAETGRPVSPVSVELSPDGVPEEVPVGVVVSLSSAPDEGRQWNEAAEGARVAAYRYQLGGVDVPILARDDAGTMKGAAEAVRELVDEGVAGIVLATEGDHVSGALDAAAEAGVPVLMPYAGGGDPAAGSWSTGASQEQVGAALGAALDAAGASQPALVDLGGGDLPGLPTDTTIRVRPGGANADLARNAARAARGADAIVVSGPAELQAPLVQALQSRDVQLPVFLSDDAVSPAFADTLARSGASLSSPLTTAGLDTDDVAALDSGTSGAAVSAYLAAVRVTAEDGEVTDFFDNEPFETVAGAADVRSHDAVVALVTAAAAAASADPADVQEALASLTVDHTDGAAGPTLEFGSASTVAADSVVPLQATTQDPGLRPVSLAGTPRLYWFAAPTD
ncbi:ABC transporter substrate-binding protein [Nocardioides euryhalodurans]|uniref:Leucine-binding protein domain-containing protein n=1 Tax=Nocardioides euryhalodurans TaxID=2518370 RepID=A0A4P7GLC0_9ACTN|nr:ABC transporter substrate-binding protein [Nocardioides euryhalodurans]QBR92886.1 hypothetical protein EXE57_11820 [Nocardioides euryhalodurans]